MQIEQNNFNNLVTQIETTHQTLQAQAINYPQISQTVTDQFKIQQTVSVKSIVIPTKQLLNSCSFSHFIEFLKIDDLLKRLFYEVETIKGNWSIRELKRQINSATYERIGLSKSKKELIASIQSKSEQQTKAVRT